MPRPTTGAAYLALVLAILGGVVFGVFLMIPTYSTWRGEQLRLEASIARQQEQQTFLENIDARTAELHQLDRDVRALQILFPETIATPELQAVMQGLASRNGVAITQMTNLGARKATRDREASQQAATPTTTSKAELSKAGADALPTSPRQEQQSESTPYEFGVSIRGSYAQVRAFITDLEHALRFFDLQTIALSVERGDKNVTGPISAQLNIWTYLATEP